MASTPSCSSRQNDSGSLAPPGRRMPMPIEGDRLVRARARSSASAGLQVADLDDGPLERRQLAPCAGRSRVSLRRAQLGQQQRLGLLVRHGEERLVVGGESARVGAPWRSAVARRAPGPARTSRYVASASSVGWSNSSVAGSDVPSERVSALRSSTAISESSPTSLSGRRSSTTNVSSWPSTWRARPATWPITRRRRCAGRRARQPSTTVDGPRAVASRSRAVAPPRWTCRRDGREDAGGPRRRAAARGSAPSRSAITTAGGGVVAQQALELRRARRPVLIQPRPALAPAVVALRRAGGPPCRRRPTVPTPR